MNKFQQSKSKPRKSRGRNEVNTSHQTASTTDVNKRRLRLVQVTYQIQENTSQHQHSNISNRYMVRSLLFWVCFCFAHFYVPASGQAVVTGVIRPPPRFLPSIFIAHRVQQSHCSSIVHRVLLTHALAFSASQFVHRKKSPRIYTNMHSGGFELTKLTYTRLEDNLIRHCSWYPDVGHRSPSLQDSS